MSLWGTSPVVQWLKFCAPNARGPGSIPGQGTRAHTAPPTQKKNYLTFLLRKFLLSICILSLSHNKVSCFVMSITWPLPAFSSVQFSRSVVSDSLRPHESQHARPPCPSPTPGVHSDSRPSRQWCHPAISSSVIPFSSCPQSLPASVSFPMSHFSIKLLRSSESKASVTRLCLYSWYLGEKKIPDLGMTFRIIRNISLVLVLTIGTFLRTQKRVAEFLLCNLITVWPCAISYITLA